MTTKIAPRIEKMSLNACLAMAYRDNPKEHDIPSLHESFERFGFVAFPSIDEKTLTMVAGHGRCEALKVLRDSGEPPPAGIEVDQDDWLVPVVRGVEFENEEERNAYVIADNQHTIGPGWSLEKLQANLHTFTSYEGLGFTTMELEGFGVELAPFEREEPPPLEGPHAVDGPVPPAPPTPTMVREVDAPDPVAEGKPTITKLGDVWILGNHVLVCGDATKDGIAQAVMVAQQHVGMIWTDPPWNVAIDAGAGKPSGRGSTRRQQTTIMNDALGAEFPEFCKRFIAEMASVASPGVAAYIAMSAQEWSTVDIAMRSAFHWSSTIIWAKNALILSRKDYHPQYEPIWYGWREGGPRKVPLRDHAQSDLWQIDRPRASDLHPTMKPIRLVARAIENSSLTGELILDPFGGSGSTMIAAEQVGRRSALVELDPRYCDVIVERFEHLTGIKAQRR